MLSTYPSHHAWHVILFLNASRALAALFVCGSNAVEQSLMWPPCSDGNFCRLDATKHLPAANITDIIVPDDVKSTMQQQAADRLSSQPGPLVSTVVQLSVVDLGDLTDQLMTLLQHGSDSSSNGHAAAPGTLVRVVVGQPEVEMQQVQMDVLPDSEPAAGDNICTPDQQQATQQHHHHQQQTQADTVCPASGVPQTAEPTTHVQQQQHQHQHVGSSSLALTSHPAEQLIEASTSPRTADQLPKQALHDVGMANGYADELTAAGDHSALLQQSQHNSSDQQPPAPEQDPQQQHRQQEQQHKQQQLQPKETARPQRTSARLKGAPSHNAAHDAGVPGGAAEEPIAAFVQQWVASWLPGCREQQFGNGKHVEAAAEGSGELPLAVHHAADQPDIEPDLVARDAPTVSEVQGSIGKAVVSQQGGGNDQSVDGQAVAEQHQANSLTGDLQPATAGVQQAAAATAMVAAQDVCITDNDMGPRTTSACLKDVFLHPTSDDRNTSSPWQLAAHLVAQLLTVASEGVLPADTRQRILQLESCLSEWQWSSLQHTQLAELYLDWLLSCRQSTSNTEISGANSHNRPAATGGAHGLSNGLTSAAQEPPTNAKPLKQSRSQADNGHTMVEHQLSEQAVAERCRAHLNHVSAHLLSSTHALMRLSVDQADHNENTKQPAAAMDADAMVSNDDQAAAYRSSLNAFGGKAAGVGGAQPDQQSEAPSIQTSTAAATRATHAAWASCVQAQSLLNQSVDDGRKNTDTPDTLQVEVLDLWGRHVGAPLTTAARLAEGSSSEQDDHHPHHPQQQQQQLDALQLQLLLRYLWAHGRLSQAVGQLSAAEVDYNSCLVICQQMQQQQASLAAKVRPAAGVTNEQQQMSSSIQQYSLQLQGCLHDVDIKSAVLQSRLDAMRQDMLLRSADQLIAEGRAQEVIEKLKPHCLDVTGETHRSPYIGLTYCPYAADNV